MISQIRELVASNLESAPWPVYSHKPDDVEAVPCVVVDRPTIEIDVQHHIVTLPVVVIGRRDGTEDAQKELDDTAAKVANMLAGPQLAVQRIEPAIATVAELTYPAYAITVSCGVTYC